MSSDEDQELSIPLIKKDEKIFRRIIGLDLMRGFIMFVMAWDHVEDLMYTEKKNGQEMWDGPYPDWNHNIYLLISRIVSHICAPGFFFTMGFGMSLFYASRKKKNWSTKRILTFFFKRGIFLVVVEKIANSSFHIPGLLATLFGTTNENVDIAQNIISLVIGFSNLSMLGFSMILCSIFILHPLSVCKIKPVVKFLITLVFCVLSFALSNAVIVHFQHNDPSVQTDIFPSSQVEPSNVLEFFVRVLIVPGYNIFHSYSNYVLFPWIGLAALGIGTGILFSAVKPTDQESFFKSMRIAGGVLIILFLFVRGFGGKFGNLRGFPRGDDLNKNSKTLDYVIQFLNTLKYPPSPAYALWTTGVNLNLIAFFSLYVTEEMVSKSYFFSLLKVLGKAPLFFYIFHLPFTSVISFICSVVFNKQTHPGMYSVPHFYWLPFVWIFVLGTFYPLNKRYVAFKGKTAENSIWRYL